MSKHEFAGSLYATRARAREAFTRWFYRDLYGANPVELDLDTERADLRYSLECAQAVDDDRPFEADLLALDDRELRDAIIAATHDRAGERIESTGRIGYVAVGSVRGWCGHVHRSLDTARECIERDNRSCRAVGGYSDRWVRVVDSHGRLYRAG